MSRLAIDLCGIKMKNPVMAASGCFGYGLEFQDLIDLNALGAFVTKGTTLEPRPGNAEGRLAETRAGVLNAIGLQNVGVDALIEEKLPKLAAIDVPVLVNIAGSTIEEYVEVARRLNAQSAVAALEINISCPNVKQGGMAFGTDPDCAGEVTRAIREVVTNMPIIPKLSPNVSDITAIAASVIDAGADAISLINTLTGMAIDIHTRKPKLSNIFGGLSGPAIRPVGVAMVRKCYTKVCKGKIPIIGMGGIQFPEDAIEFILAGASAVAIGTANYIDPESCTKVAAGIDAYLAEAGIPTVNELVGQVEE